MKSDAVYLGPPLAARRDLNRDFIFDLGKVMALHKVNSPAANAKLE